MPRLYRPHVPLEVRCRVALRQLGEMWPDRVIAEYRGRLGLLLKLRLLTLGCLLNCDDRDLRLDHDPPLGARPQFRRGLGKKVYYQPDANDPEHLIYREKHAHFIKTNVRGEHGQHPDRVLIKKERRRKKKGQLQRSLDNVTRNQKQSKWRSRALRGASRWPPKGARKIGSRRK